MTRLTVAAYVYPGWHPCPERDQHFPDGWSEWDLVYQAKSTHPDQRQPNIPRDGCYDDSRPDTARRQVELATAHGVNLFVYGFFWSRGKRVFEDALKKGFLPTGTAFPFALMWANRMPRRVLPVKRAAGNVIDPGRLVHTDPDDFLELIRYAADTYFVRDNYYRVGGVPYLSIFDTTFFLRQLGLDRAASAIAAAKRWLADRGLGGLHLAAIDPIPEHQPHLREIGFDSVTHYVLLPEWKGEPHQDYQTCADDRAGQWASYRDNCALPFYPSVSPGWDATPRAADYGAARPDRYPWSPVVTGSNPEQFARLLRKASLDVTQNEESPHLFVASWNEWSEGHYLEPDTQFGLGWLRAIQETTRP